jgi:hypothetical protein
MIPPIMSFTIQVHGGKLDGLYLPHRVKLQVRIHFLYPRLCSHLGRSIEVWDFHFSSPALKLIIAYVVRPRFAPEFELRVLIKGHLPLNCYTQIVVFPGTLRHLLNKVIYGFMLCGFICERGQVWSRSSPATCLSMWCSPSMAPLRLMIGNMLWMIPVPSIRSTRLPVVIRLWTFPL